MRAKSNAKVAEESVENKLSSEGVDDDVVDVSGCGDGYVVVLYVDAPRVPEGIFGALNDLSYRAAGVEKVNYTTNVEDVFKLTFWYE